MQKPGINSRKLGGECLLYDDVRGSIHVLNSVAEFVWSLCDGEHDVAEMEAKIREAFEVPPGQEIRGDITSILEEFRQLEVFENKSGIPSE
jgi:hypothetical protein